MKINNLILLFFLACLVWPLCAVSPVRAGGVEKVYSAPAEKIAEYVLTKPGRKVIFIYASWCPYCRQNMQAMIDLETMKPGSVFAVSADQDPQALGIYLNTLQNVPFEALRMTEGNNSNALEDAFGVPARRGIPYKILLDENNKAQQAGNFSPDFVAEYILGKQKQ